MIEGNMKNWRAWSLVVCALLCFGVWCIGVWHVFGGSSEPAIAQEPIKLDLGTATRRWTLAAFCEQFQSWHLQDDDWLIDVKCTRRETVAK